MDKKREERVIRDVNGFYCKQVRFVPVEDWESNDGWRTYYKSSIAIEDIPNERFAIVNEYGDRMGIEDIEASTSSEAFELYRVISGVSWSVVNSYGLHAVRATDVEADKIRVCPKCGKGYKGYPAISRRDNKTEICTDCGVVEATEDYNNWVKGMEDKFNGR